MCVWAELIESSGPIVSGLDERHLIVRSRLLHCAGCADSNDQARQADTRNPSCAYTVLTRSLLENQHEVSQEQEQVDGSEQDIGASDGKGQHTDHKGQDQENGVDRVDAENDR